jgi:phenylalanyl-tRNA synthetase beta chain
MKISLEWLADFLSPVPDGVAAGESLTHGGLPVESIETIGGDTVIDVEVTSNRGDCLSHVGVARELAALRGSTFEDVAPSAPETNEPASAAASVRIDAADLCPHYIARIIRGVKIGPSPTWMVRRLEAVGLRPINNVVDVTNYVMFEIGQPLHAFDFAKITGRQVIVRAAQPGEKIISIDGKQRDLSPGMLVIADAHRPIALAGVMGGVDSEVSGATADILLESARFDPLSIRKTARALAMKSDSSHRFERGIDPTLPARASLRAAELILQTAGGKLLGGIVEAGSAGYQPKQLSLRLARLKKILGVDWPADRVAEALGRLGLRPKVADGVIHVTVPSHRLDINVEIDLIEEAARLIGYDQIPTRQEISIRVTPPELETITTNNICQILVGSGYFEAVTFSFVSDALRHDFVNTTDGVKQTLLRADSSVRKADASLRPSLIPGLLQAVRFNESNGTPGTRLFEIGSIFSAKIDASISGSPDGNADRKAGRNVDERRMVTWVGSTDLREVRGVVEVMLNRLDSKKDVIIIPDSRAGFAKGACGQVRWGGQAIGYIGKIDRAIADKLSLREIPAAAELELAALLAGARHVPQLSELPKFPAIRRDLSLVVAESVRYEKIDSLLRGLKLPDLEEIQYITTYRGKPLEKGTKSVTITLVFRSATATLLSEQVETSVQTAVMAAKDQLQATLRV